MQNEKERMGIIKVGLRQAEDEAYDEEEVSSERQ
jgi:hypothetical protein